MGVLWRMLIAYGLLCSHSANAQAIPACRLDSFAAPLVEETIKRAAQTYRQLGKALPFDSVIINPKEDSESRRTLTAYIVADANSDGIDANGCATQAVTKDDPLDELSVRGGCRVVSSEKLELRCSSSAVALFGYIGQKPGRANPTLLYVLAHELGHIYQRQAGEYEGQVAQLDLAQTREAKLQALQASCDPVSTRREEEADTYALEVMKLLLPEPPYREPLFSERGSLLWNVDQLVLAANAWQQSSLAQEFISRPVVHQAFVPTEFPTPDVTVEANARKFVCDALSGNSGAIYHPLQSTTHPSLDQRMGRIAEAMRPISASLPNDTSKTQFESIAELQSDLSPIFSQIYRETAVYMEAVQAAICTMVNSPELYTCQ
jgi:hypothetical protein